MLCQTFVRRSFFLLFFAVSTPLLHAKAGHEPASGVLRHYPLAGALEVSPRTQIGITTAGAFPSDVPSSAFKVTGSHSGNHEGRVHISLDRGTIIFAPAVPFDLNESVRVELSANLSEGILIRDTFSFITVQIDPSGITSHRTGKLTAENALDTIPPPPPPPPPPPGDSVPWIEVFNVGTYLNPTPGNIYIAPGSPLPQAGSHLLVLNQDAKLTNSAFRNNSFDFELQENGERTYFSTSDSVYYGLDSNLRTIDTFRTRNGYPTDEHELRVFKDGSYTLLGITHSTIPLSDIVPGVPGSLPVDGGVIQRFDAAGNLIFEWRGVDHYDILDGVAFYVAGQALDFQHANSIDIDSNGNYLLSNRSLSEITKINGATGDIIWRFGGLHNQYTLVNDSLGFSCQHYARWLPNGHMLMFDNGNFHPDGQSRAVEYAMDETNFTATRVWQFYHTPAIYSQAMGSVQRLPNGNTFIGWGLNFQTIATEVTPDGQVAFDLSSQYQLLTYRALKYPTAVSALVSSTNPQPSGLSLVAASVPEGIDLAITAAQPSSATITMCDAAGRTVQNIFHSEIVSGTQHIGISTRPLASGVYFCVLRSAEGTVVRPVMVTH
jgi:hypothetical protein